MDPLLPGWPRCLLLAWALRAACLAAPQGAAVPTADDERVRLLSALAASGASAVERVAAAERLLALALEEAQLAVVVQAFGERDRRELAALLDRTLRSATATPLQWTNAARVAELAPDAALAPALLDRLDAALEQDPAGARMLVRSLRAALEAARRRTVELEVERLAQAPVEFCVAQLDHAAPEVRRAALSRLVELARRRGEGTDHALERARARALARLEPAAPDALAPAAIAADELRLLAALAAELSPRDAAVKRRFLSWLERAEDSQTQIALLEALRRAVRDDPDAEVAAAAAKLLEPGPSPERTALVEAGLVALRFVGDESSLESILPWLSPDAAPAASLRKEAVAATAELARRDPGPAFARRAVAALSRALEEDPSDEVRLGAALGLALVADAIGARPREQASVAALDAENLGRIFDALRRALPAAVRDRALAEQCAKTLCRVPGRQEASARVLADVLLAREAAPPVREVLLRRLEELGEPAGLPAIVAALPKGGPAVEPDALGKAAYAALLAVVRRADAPRVRVDVKLEAVAACLAAGEPEWAAQVATPLLDLIEEPDHEERRVEIRLAFGRAAARARAPETLERGFRELLAALEDPDATAAQRREGRLALLELAERTRPLHAEEAAESGEALLQGEELSASERVEAMQRCASLWLVAGQWGRAYDLLDRELDEGLAPTNLLVLKARAAARLDGGGALKDALRLHELLVGERGRGGRLGAEASDRAALVLSLARIYLDGERLEDARATLAALPAPDSLPAELRDSLDQLKRRVSS